MCLVAQLCLTLCNPIDCSPPGSSVHGNSPGKNTGVVAMPSSRGSFQPRDWTQVSCIAGGFFTIWATGKAHYTTISSVQFSRSVMSESLWPHESQHARPPCPSPLPEFTQTHVHRVSDAIQPSHPLSSPSPPAPNPSQHQSLLVHDISSLLEESPLNKHESQTRFHRIWF